MASASRTAISTPATAESNPFPIFAELELKTKALEEAKVALRHAVEENGRLTAERDAVEKDTYAVAEMLRRDLQEKSARIQQLTETNDKIRAECEAEISGVKEEALDERRRLEREKKQQETELQSKISDLEWRLTQVQEFRDRQEEMEQVVFHFQSEKKSLDAKSEQQVKDLEQNFFQETQRLKREHAHQLEQQRIETESACDKCLDDRVKQILSQNRRMAVELSVHKEETAALRREVRQLDVDRRRLGEEVQFCNDLENGYAKRGAEQGKLVKAARSRISALEQSMRHLLGKTVEEQQRWRRQQERQTEEAALEAAALKRLAIAKGKENNTLRKLAQEVLMQRTDVEKLLISSLSLVALMKHMERV